MLTSKVTLRVDAALSKELDLSTPSDTLALKSVIELANGTGLAQANRVYHDKKTIPATSAIVVDLFDFSGEKDPLGDVLALSKIKGIFIINLATASDAILKVGGEGSAAAWNSAFDGVDTSLVTVGPRGFLAISNPSAAGWAVADSTNHLLNLYNAGAGAMDIQIAIIGV